MIHVSQKQANEYCTRSIDDRDAVIYPFRHVAISIHRNEFLLRGENPAHLFLEDELFEFEVDLHLGSSPRDGFSVLLSERKNVENYGHVLKPTYSFGVTMGSSHSRDN